MPLSHGVAISLLVLICFALGLERIGLQHSLRQHVAVHQQQQAEEDALHQAWTQWLLELGTWRAHARVRRLAEEELGMVFPQAEDSDVVVLDEAP